MKFLILSSLLVAAATQNFVGQPAQLVLRRSQNRAILEVNQNVPSNQGLQYQRQSFSSSQRFGEQEGFSTSGQRVSGSSGTFGSSQGVVGTRQEFSETIPVFLDTIQSEDGIGSRPGFTSISSQTFSKQPSQRPDSQEHTTFSSESSYRNSQQNIRNNQQQRFTISQQDYRSLPHESFTRNQQDSNKFSQTISSLQQQPGRIQPSNSFQTSSRNVQVNINTQYNNQQFQHSGESFISSNEKEISGVFEPLNLPSGATRLMGEISTSFTCIDQPYGYYADLQNSCRVFHVCYPALFSTDRIETYQYSFMCGEGTQFDQKEMTCVKESDAIPCANSQEYFFRNGEFGLPEERAKF